MSDNLRTAFGDVPGATIEYTNTGTLEGGGNGFLSLGVRRVLYIVAIAVTAIAPVLAVTRPEYAAAIVAGAGVLNTAALGTALANPAR